MVSILVTIVGITGIVSLSKVDTNSGNMYSNNLQSVYMLTNMIQNLTQEISDVLKLIFIKDASQKIVLEKDIQSN